MKKFTRMAAPILALALLAGTTACSTDEPAEAASSPSVSKSKGVVDSVKEVQSEGGENPGEPFDSEATQSEVATWINETVLPAVAGDASKYMAENPDGITGIQGDQQFVNEVLPELPNINALIHPDSKPDTDTYTKAALLFSLPYLAPGENSGTVTVDTTQIKAESATKATLPRSAITYTMGMESRPGAGNESIVFSKTSGEWLLRGVLTAK